MRRNCNLELRHIPSFEIYKENMQQQQQQQHRQLTIFYNGRVSVCDVTQLQARAIITLASKEMEEKLKSILGSEPSSPSQNSRILYGTYANADTGLLMKRSLQHFLQKRKNRIQSSSPYSRPSV